MTTCTPTPIRRDEPFRFGCSPEVSCFNACCRDLNQFLTPYDIVRLKNHLGLSSGEFLASHTRWHVGPQTGLPIVILKEAEPVKRTCRFLSRQGCSVYPHRPSSCRVYPLIRTVGIDPGTLQKQEAYMVLREPHCKGFFEATQQTVADWINDQGLAEYNHYNDKLLTFINRKRRLRPGPVDQRDRPRVFMALYDLDALRKVIVNKGCLEGLPIEPGEMDPAVADDIALLRLGLRWINAILFDPKS